MGKFVKGEVGGGELERDLQRGALSGRGVINDYFGLGLSLALASKLHHTLGEIIEKEDCEGVRGRWRWWWWG